MIAASIRIVASIAAVAAPATLTADVVNAAVERATLTAEISTALVDAYEGRSIRTGYKIKLDGAFLPGAALTGDCEIAETLDSPMAFATFRLVGREYSPLATDQTWTKKPIEIWWLNGPAGAGREELRFAGYVRTGSSDGGHVPVVTVHCTNEAGLYDRWELCHEIEPLSGLRRGEIVRELCADAGLTAVDTPDGAEYTKPIQATNNRLFDYLRDFIEPEGWKSRFAGPTGRTFQVYTPRLKQAPEAPEDVWRGRDLVSVTVTPPADVPSRWVVRGYGAVYVDEAGQESKVTVTEVSALYAPKIAVSQQDAAGVVTATTFTAPAATLRVIQRITDTQVSQAGKLLTQDTLEEGWYNRSAARLVTNAGGAGSEGNGYDYLSVYIDEEDRYVLDWIESFGEKGRRRLAITYDELGSAVGELTQVYRYGLRTQGVRSVGSATVNVAGAYVHGDDQSYSDRYESYGLAEEHAAAREFLEDGSEALLAVDSHGFRALRCAVGPGTISGLYVRYDGQGQNEVVANWRRYARSEKRNLMSEGDKVGELEQTYGYDTHRRSQDGPFEWGEFTSNSPVEQWLLADSKLVQYDVLSTDHYQKTTFEPGKKPVVETFSGRVPPVRYRWSPWVVLAQQPIELAIDDPVVEGWFGFGRTVIQNDHVQSQAEAERVLANRRARALAHKVTIERHESLARVGDTVLLLVPGNALADRALLVGARVRRNRLAPSQTGSYELEVRL